MTAANSRSTIDGTHGTSSGDRASIAGQAASTPAPKHTALEEAAVDRLRARAKKEPPSAKFKVVYGDDTLSIDPDHADPSMPYVLFTDALKTSDPTFAQGILYQLAEVSRTGEKLTARELNMIISTVRAIDPKDSTEALLACQMAAVHNATMVAARRLNHVDTIDQQNSASNMLNKLGRTFASQLEALKRYRSSGEQKVTVNHQHVNVSANQAVVGVRQGGGDVDENRSQSHAPGAAKASVEPDAGSPALLRHEQTLGMPMPSASREGPACVPHARSQGGRPGGRT